MEAGRNSSLKKSTTQNSSVSKSFELNSKLWKTSPPRRKSKLTFDGVSLPFPENIHSWLKGSEYLPDTTLSDLENYFKANNGVKALAEGKSLFESGHVSSVEYNGISNGVSFCYVRGKVVPQTRINNPPYTVWFVYEVYQVLL